MSRSLSTAFQCHGCRHNTLSAFAALAGVTLRSAPRLHTLCRSRTWHRSLTTSSPRLFQHPSPPKAASNLESAQQASEVPPTTSVSSSQPLPWYLQVESALPPLPPSNPNLLARQQIPALPPNPPPVLSPMLEYLSLTSGLDSLALLDLRGLTNPPPALGANLLMVIGTARSIKHLNVSADRFCRWLRTNYRLRPYADGLLGRNELKLKLRRRERRLKLARSVGNKAEEERMAMAGRDDGITTGWICVNVGAVNEAVLPPSATAAESPAPAAPAQFARDDEIDAGEEDEYRNDDATYVGFGSSATAPRIVVQMFTEDKRAEMDLEGLWDVRAARRAKKDDAAQDRAEAAAAAAAVADAEAQVQDEAAPAVDADEEVRDMRRAPA